jgi:orotidine-5'-phosphate decarboxylase
LADSTLSPHQRIIFALDYQSFEEARPFIEKLKDKVGLFKIGWTLLLSEGLNVLAKIHDIEGVSERFFLDIKYASKSVVEDIPQQVGGMASVITAKAKGVEFITVHTAFDSEAGVRESVRKFRTNGTKILGITVLTSMNQESLNATYHSNLTPQQKVLELAEKAKNAGCDGVVCSGHEAQAVKNKLGSDFIVVTPGIRPAWFEIKKDDQKRIVTPGDAVKNGADYIVVGRPISTAKDPTEAAERADRIAEEIAAALK